MILKVFPKAACWTWKLFQMQPVILKIVSNAACDPENCPNATCDPEIVPQAACESKSCSESRLWPWKLFRKPPVILQVFPNGACETKSCSEYPPVIMKIVRKPPGIPKVFPKAAYDIILADYFCIQWWLDPGKNRPITENRNFYAFFSAVFTISTIKHNTNIHFFS